MEDAMADDQKYRLKTRLPNGAEFEAEGSEAVVQALFEKFLAASQAASPSRDTKILPPRPPAEETPEEEKGEQSAISNRVFAQDKAGTLSLLALPKGENRDPDTVLMLLFGYHQKGQETVTVGVLKKAAQKSGVQLDRVDRVLAPYSSYVTKSGLRKGSRYGLNNQGLIKAQALVDGVMG
jgi:hypothetical protein